MGHETRRQELKLKMVLQEERIHRSRGKFERRTKGPRDLPS